MRNARTLIGMPLVGIDRGTDPESIAGFILDPSESRVAGLIVGRDEDSRQLRVVPFPEIMSFDPAKVVVDSRDVIHIVNEAPAIRRVQCLDDLVAGTVLIANDDTVLGTIADFVFDEATGKIGSFVVFDDSGSGRRPLGAGLILYDELNDELVFRTANVRQLSRSERFAVGDRTDLDEMSSCRTKVVGMQRRNPENETSICGHASNESHKPHATSSIQGALSQLGRWAKFVLVEVCQYVCDAMKTNRMRRALRRRMHSILDDINVVTNVPKHDVLSSRASDARTKGRKDVSRVADCSAAVPEKPRSKQFRGCFDEWWPPYL
jgi:uncharacterized protein YrrD